MLLFSKRVTYYFVYLPGVDCHLFYLSRWRKYRAGDTVTVPYGWANRKVPGIVIWAREFSRTNLPVPVEKMKYIVGQASREMFGQCKNQSSCAQMADRRA